MTPESTSRTAAAIEAVLTVATEPVPPGLLAELLELPVERVEELCLDLGDRHTRPRAEASRSRGWPAATASRAASVYAAYVERFVLDGGPQKLSPAALETLAVVAYKQPISRSQVAAIRGVNVESVMRMLVARGYVQAVGRDDGPGQAGAVRDDADVPRAARPRLDRGPPAAGSIRPARFDRRDAREGAALRAGRVSEAEGERLQKVLARVGYGSRTSLRGAHRRRQGQRQRRGRRPWPSGRGGK